MIKMHQKSGFSLIETLVAVSLLLIIIVGPMAISAKTAKSTSFASEQVQAYFLAQEGLEMAQKARDDFRLAELDSATAGDGSGWTNFTDSSATGAFQNCFKPTGCGLWWGTTPGKLQKFGAIINGKDCTFANSCRIYINNADVRSKFTSASSTAGVPNEITPFVRKIYFTTNNSGREIKVRSEVTWRTGSIIADQKVVLDTYLFNTDYENN